MKRWATLAVGTAACRLRRRSPTPAFGARPADGWITLFDGKNLDQWQGDGTATFVIEDGSVIAKDKKDPKAVAAYLVTKESLQGLRDPRRVLGQRRRQQRHLHPLHRPEEHRQQDRLRGATSSTQRPDPTYGTGAHRAVRQDARSDQGRRQVEHL